MKERVLITGATGFVGYHLIQAALSNQLEVVAAIRPTSKTAQLKALDIRYTELDFTDIEALKLQLEKYPVQYIIHAAGVTKAKTNEEYTTINAQYTRNLAQAAAIANIPLKKFVFISSLAAIGPVAYNNTQPISEDTPPNPVTAYGKSKLLAEKHLLAFKNLPWVILRPTAVYGPLEKDIFIIFKTIKQGLDPYIGRGQQQFSFVYVKDLAQVVLNALNARPVHTAYNISDGKKYGRYALADYTKKLLGKKAWRLHLPLPLVNLVALFLEKWYRHKENLPALNKEKLNELTAENWFCSIEKAETELSYQPAYDLEKGLTQTLQWYTKHKWL